MQLQVIKTSVVVLASGHNPSILHPAFLTSQKIVPEDWQLSEPPLSTPAFSVVKFQNGFVFVVESQKFEVADNNVQDPLQSEAPILALKYIKALPHVAYSAVGINLIGFVEYPDASAFVKERFLRKGPWNDEAINPTSVGLRLIYPYEQAVLHLSINAGRAKIAKAAEKIGILIDGNYHVDLTTAAPLEEAEASTSRFKEFCGHYLKYVKIIVGLEEE